MYAKRLLDSAEPGHIEPCEIDQLQKRLTMVIKMKNDHFEFRLDQFCTQTITAATFTTCPNFELKHG